MIRLLAAIFTLLPLSASALLCRALAGVWWWILPIRKRVAVENLRAAFPELPPGPTLRRGFAEALLGYAELLRHQRRPLPPVEFEGIEPILERFRAGQGGLILAGHGGAWDLCVVLMVQQLRVPTSVLVRTPSSGAVDRLVRQLRGVADLELLPPVDATRRVLAALREGRMVLFLLDQRHNSGIPVPFFGRPAWTSRGLALIAARSKVPVFGVWQTRSGLGRHHVRFYPPFALSGDPEADTAAFSRFYEDRIRERPYAWLWLHDRWRKP